MCLAKMQLEDRQGAGHVGGLLITVDFILNKMESH